MFLKTQRGNKTDTNLMRQVGASFDWSLLLWWVPSGTQLSAEYEDYLLDPDDNAAFNSLHDAVMETVAEDDED